MSRKVTFRGVVRGITADEKKFEAKFLVDPTDISAHEELLMLRGRELMCTVEETQMSLDDEGWGYE